MYRLDQNIINLLLEIPHSRLTYNKKELLMRCPFCGDSLKHIDKTHLYLNVENDEPNSYFPYYCQRCKASGILNKDFLKIFQIYDSDAFRSIAEINLNCKYHNKKKQKITLNEKRKLKIPSITDSKLNRIKLRYINKRLGLNLTYADLAEYKCVFSLYDLLDLNNITSLSCKESMTDILDSNFLGFVSYDNTHLIMRNLSKKVLPEMRYYNYNIFNSPQGDRFFTLKNQIDLLSPAINIYATEGVFDLFGVYNHIMKNTKESNMIYTAICGTGYINVIKKFLNLGFLEMNINIFSDKDQNLFNYRKLKKVLKPFVSDVQVFYNQINKDFGVKKDLIKISKTII